MKKLLNESVAFCLLLVFGVFTQATQASAPSEWKWEQRFELEFPGLVKVAIPVETITHSRENLDDLRILRPDGKEVPYLIDRQDGMPESGLIRSEFKTLIKSNQTEIFIETNTDKKISAIILEAQSAPFTKAAKIEGSRDRKTWSTLSEGEPIFSIYNGNSRNRIKLEKARWKSFRLTIDDQRAQPIAFTQVFLETSTDESPMTERVALTAAPQIENADETRINVDLGAANLFIKGITVETPDKLFYRNVSVLEKKISTEGVSEESVAQENIYRANVGSTRNSENLFIPVNRQISSREIVVSIANHDNPPLTITGIRAERKIVFAVFNASQAGSYVFASGNPLARSPNYDLSALSRDLTKLQVTNIKQNALELNPAYQKPEELPDIPETTAPFNANGWHKKTPITISNPGVQKLDLPLDVIAQSQSGYSDIRVVLNGKQVPFLFDRSSLTKPVPIKVELKPVEKSSSISRWEIKLPYKNLPISKISFSTTLPIFSRNLNLYEKVTDPGGSEYHNPLAIAQWTRANENGRKALTLTMSLDRRINGDTVYLETDNGDNALLELADFKAYYPVTSILFKASGSKNYELYFANPQASAPSYDIQLIASAFYVSKHEEATTSGDESIKPAFSDSVSKETAGVWFWVALSLVVVVLIFVISKLLPKQG